MEVGIIGAGNMARAIAAGLGQSFLVTDSGSGRAAEIAATLGGEVAGGNDELAGRSDVVFLCHKPAQLQSVAAELSTYDRVIVSALAATPVQALRDSIPSAQIVRIMPNTPVEAGAGVVVVSDASDIGDDVTELLTRLGSVEVVPEKMMEVATAIGGCAPAFFARFAQRLVEAGAERGLDPEQAARIVGDTLAGTGAITRRRDYDMKAVQREVASPGGLTERALQSFDENGLDHLVDAAVDAVTGAG